MEENNVQYELCPETGIGSLILGKDDAAFRFDLMPDEAVELSNMVKSGNLDGARDLLVSILPESAETLKNVSIEELSKQIG
ncbi:MAG: hypothetical protein ACYC27_11800 [Armatimonadota bacterium]